tara:strand:- start:508 stop:726 length:219 start_codon:yes stop_codon:yes gene_type:complete
MIKDKWHLRLDAYMEGMGWHKRDIAAHLGRTLNSIEVSFGKKNLPATYKLAIITFEIMKGRMASLFDKNKGK